MKDWRTFERLVARLTSEQYDASYTIIPNARVTGYISKRKRQLDVLVDYRYDADLSRRIIIDAKNKTRPIDVKEVETFEGLMKDVSARYGIIVCTNGYSKAAKRRAQEHIGIMLITDEEIEEFSLSSWDKCLDESCKKGLVLWDANPDIVVNNMHSIQAIGKCDECGKFHIWCWDCTDRKVMLREEDWQCSCKGPWFWLTSIEQDKDEDGLTNDGHYLILVLGNGNYHIVDRRPL